MWIAFVLQFNSLLDHFFTPLSVLLWLHFYYRPKCSFLLHFLHLYSSLYLSVAFIFSSRIHMPQLLFCFIGLTLILNPNFKMKNCWFSWISSLQWPELNMFHTFASHKHTYRNVMTMTSVLYLSPLLKDALSITGHRDVSRQQFVPFWG